MTRILLAAFLLVAAALPGRAETTLNGWEVGNKDGVCVGSHVYKDNEDDDAVNVISLGLVKAPDGTDVVIMSLAYQKWENDGDEEADLWIGKRRILTGAKWKMHDKHTLVGSFTGAKQLIEALSGARQIMLQFDPETKAYFKIPDPSQALGALQLCLSSSSSTAPRARASSGQTFSVPKNDPAFTITFPSSWKIDDIDYGFSAMSPDKDVKAFVEYAQGKQIEQLKANNEAWMRQRGIKPKGDPETMATKVAGLPGMLVRYQATDEWGDTLISFLALRASNDRIILFTLWGSKDEREANSQDIQRINDSIRPVN